MGVGKYSPTVSHSYASDDKWFEKNGGGWGNGIDPESFFDDQGFDEYGYNAQGVDRAGNEEHLYGSCSYLDESGDLVYQLAMSVRDEWSGVDIGKEAAKRRELRESDPDFLKDCQAETELASIIKEAQRQLAIVQARIKQKAGLRSLQPL